MKKPLIIFDWMSHYKISYIICFLLLNACRTPETQTLPYYNSADLTPHWYSRAQLDTVNKHIIGDFQFMDQSGEFISEKSVKGKIYVANFFFTICPSICPTMTQNLLAVQEAFRDDTEIMLLSHSVMPANDSVAQLQGYAERWKINPRQWHLLTGDKAQIYQLARKAYFAEKEMGLQKDSKEFLHTENAFLIDKNGYIRGVYNATLPLDIENMINDIKILKAEGE